MTSCHDCPESGFTITRREICCRDMAKIDSAAQKVAAAFGDISAESVKLQLLAMARGQPRPPSAEFDRPLPLPTPMKGHPFSRSRALSSTLLHSGLAAHPHWLSGQ